MIFLDTEVARDYFLAVFSDAAGKHKIFEMYDGHPLDRVAILSILKNFETCGFNSLNYDLPIIITALKLGATTQKIFEVSQNIIVNEIPGWQIAQVPSSWRHVDLKEVAPGVMVSLKIYGGRMHTRQMQDLPFDPNADVLHDRERIIEYCKNDVRITAELYASLKEQIDLRRSMTEQYSLNLLSKSDAQIAEAVLIKEIESKRKNPVFKPGLKETSVMYSAPSWVQFDTAELVTLLDDILTTPFFIDNKTGRIQLHERLDGRTVSIGSGVYKFGAGGLHSTEESVSLYANDTLHLTDTDVASYYPAIILNEGLYPKQCGEEFLIVYREIVKRRLIAKANGDDVTAASLKVSINGSFGKMGSKYSKLYAPNLLLQTTVTGQLGLLMLIEMLEQSGVKVVSGNTDGIVTYTDKHCELQSIVSYWESVTGFTTESVRYKSVHWANVNNYLAVKMDGKTKGKGVYASSSLMKNPAMSIVYRAVSEYLINGTPLDKTVRSGKFNEFLTVRNVKGGGYFNGQYLGKTVRFYWSTNGGPLQYKNGNQIATSAGSKPAMLLPDILPDDLDFDRYTAAAQKALKTLGVDHATTL